jgi:hypothetical protein
MLFVNPQRMGARRKFRAYAALVLRVACRQRVSRAVRVKPVPLTADGPCSARFRCACGVGAGRGIAGPCLYYAVQSGNDVHEYAAKMALPWCREQRAQVPGSLRSRQRSSAGPRKARRPDLRWPRNFSLAWTSGRHAGRGGSACGRVQPFVAARASLRTTVRCLPPCWRAHWTARPPRACRSVSARKRRLRSS